MAGEQSWLGATRQRWKLWTANVIGVAGTIASLVLLQSGNGSAETYGFLVAPGAMLVALAILWSVRCAACGYRPVIQAVADMPLTKWASHVLAMSICPGCGETGPRSE